MMIGQNGLKFTISVTEKALGFIWPIFKQMNYSSAQEKSDSERSGAELQIRIKTALLKNASFLLEPKFRLMLARELIGFVSNSDSDYDLVHSRICEILNRRSKLPALLVPSDHIKRAIRAAGFFSLTMKPSLNRQFAQTPSLRRFFLELGFLRRWGRAGWALLRAFSREPENLQQAASAYQKILLLDSSPRNSDWRGKSITLIGPSSRYELTLEAEHQVIWWLVTPSMDELALEAGLSKTNNSWLVMNNVFASIAIRELNEGRMEHLLKAKGIICAPQWLHAFRKLGMVAIYYTTPFSEMLLVGSPNLLQRAVGLAIFHDARVNAVGVNLYAGDDLYLREKKKNLHEFFTSISLASHEPVQNFRLARLAKEMGVIEGDAVFTEILELSTAQYLSRLDNGLGRLRR